jgi:hypothetical protein
VERYLQRRTRGSASAYFLLKVGHMDLKEAEFEGHLEEPGRY